MLAEAPYKLGAMGNNEVVCHYLKYLLDNQVQSDAQVAILYRELQSNPLPAKKRTRLFNEKTGTFDTTPQRVAHLVGCFYNIIKGYYI